MRLIKMVDKVRNRIKRIENGEKKTKVNRDGSKTNLIQWHKWTHKNLNVIQMYLDFK